MPEPTFEPRSLIEAARAAAGGDDLWGDRYREGFEILCDAIVREAGLQPLRAGWVTRMTIGMLATRGRIAATLARDGDAITRTPIDRPIFITGLPRTGTTMLHNLMAGLDGLRGYTPWEMRHVVPRQDTPGWQAAARSETAAVLQALQARTPELAKIHLVTVDAPDECNWLTRHSFASLVYGYMFHVPSYVRWLLERPQPRTYAEHRVQLQILAHRENPAARARLVLKDPCHLWHLAELFDTYPDALVVRLHRDPCEAVPSLCSLLHALQSTDSDRGDPRQVGPATLQLVERGLGPRADLRARGPPVRRARAGPGDRLAGRQPAAQGRPARLHGGGVRPRRPRAPRPARRPRLSGGRPARRGAARVQARATTSFFEPDRSGSGQREDCRARRGPSASQPAGARVLPMVAWGNRSNSLWSSTAGRQRFITVAGGARPTIGELRWHGPWMDPR